MPLEQPVEVNSQSETLMVMLTALPPSDTPS
jgi:hypothetical protein